MNRPAPVPERKRQAVEPLEVILRDRIRSGGPIRFRDFMEAALYDPEHGYYSSGVVRIGREGDFFTSSHVHPAFGELIAVQLREMSEATRGGAGDPFWVLEAGPGQGFLAADILRSLRGAPFPGGDRIRLGLIERSRALRRVQEQTLGAASCLEGVVWWDSLVEAARDGTRDGCLVANELLDALPVHRVVQRGGKLREIYVGLEEGRFIELEEEPSTERIGRWFAEDGIRLEEGQQAEVNLSAQDWVGGSAVVIRSGYLMILDYGYPARVLYGPERRKGTLLCYHRHRVSEDFYRRVGRQDMTAHLNLSALIRTAEDSGWSLCGTTSQMRFLVSLGILDRIRDLADRRDPGGIRERLALRQLIQPGGMGEVFRVLIFRRGRAPGGLQGLRDPFRAAGKEEMGRGRNGFPPASMGGTDV